MRWNTGVEDGLLVLIASALVWVALEQISVVWVALEQIGVFWVTLERINAVWVALEQIGAVAASRDCAGGREMVGGWC